MYYVCTYRGGMLLVSFGGFGDILSLSFAPASVVMPVGAFTLVAYVHT